MTTRTFSSTVTVVVTWHTSSQIEVQCFGYKSGTNTLYGYKSDYNVSINFTVFQAISIWQSHFTSHMACWCVGQNGIGVRLCGMGIFFHAAQLMGLNGIDDHGGNALKGIWNLRETWHDTPVPSLSTISLKYYYQCLLHSFFHLIACFCNLISTYSHWNPIGLLKMI